MELTVAARRVKVRESSFSCGKKSYRQVTSVGVGESLDNVPEEVREQVAERLASIAAEHADVIVKEAVSGMDAAAVAYKHVDDLEPLIASVASLADSLGIAGNRHIGESVQQILEEHGEADEIYADAAARVAEYERQQEPKAVDADELVKWMRIFSGAADQMSADTKRRLAKEAEAFLKAMTAAPAPKAVQADSDPFGDLLPTTASTSMGDMITATRVDDIDSYQLSESMRTQLTTAFRSTDIDALLADWKDEEGYRHVGKDNIELGVEFRRYVYGIIRQRHIAAVECRDREDVAAEISFVVGRQINAGHITQYLAINKYETAEWSPVSDSLEQDVAAFAARVGNGHIKVQWSDVESDRWEEEMKNQSRWHG
jgi:hypothetical protein